MNLGNVKREQDLQENYAAETRANSVKTKQLVKTTEMRVLRTIAGKTRRDRISNKRIREICGTNDVTKFIKHRRRAWSEHVSRTDLERLARTAKNQRPHCKRPQGRPPKRFGE